MNSVAALFHRDGQPANWQQVNTMVAAAPHRGVDGMAVKLLGEVGLGHGKLVMTQEDIADQQPLVSTHTGCVIVADVRLDNRDELLARLPDRWPASISDAEIILRAYDAWGTDAVSRLLGDFALIIWDARHRRLICARDTSGQRTLYYRVDARTFVAASEIRQLLQDPTVPIRPNHERIRTFLVPANLLRNEADQPDTFFEGIQSLEAGWMMTVERGSLRSWKYWELVPPAEIRYRTDDEYAAHYLSLFSEVVRARLRTVHPVGAWLSGGLDSSSVVCTARALARSGSAAQQKLTSFSFIFHGLDCNEYELIRDIEAMHDLDARYISCDTYSGRLWLEPAGFLESPNSGIREASTSMFGAAQQAGVRALLTGDLADGIVGGSWAVLDSLLRQGKLRKFWRFLQAYRRVSRDALPKTVVFQCLLPLLPLALQRPAYATYVCRSLTRNHDRLLPRWMPEPLRAELYAKHLSVAVNQERHRRFANGTRESEFRLMYPPVATESLSPWPLEFWRPFADRRLHQFLFAIPPEQKFSPSPESDEFYAGSKQIVRRAMRGLLPESIRTRATKTVFSSVLGEEVQQNWPTYAAAFGPGSRSEVAKHGYVDATRYWQKLNHVREGVLGNDQLYVMQMAGLETWLRSLQQPRSQLLAVSTSSHAGVAQGASNACPEPSFVNFTS